MQIELKRIHTETGITFVHVTHDQEEAHDDGRHDRGYERRSGSSNWRPIDLYEHPRTPFVAGFLGVSNLLSGTVAGDGVVRLDGGTQVRV